MNISVINLKNVFIKFIKIAIIGALIVLGMNFLKQIFESKNIVEQFSNYNYEGLLNAMLLIDGENEDKDLEQYVISSQLIIANVVEKTEIQQPTTELQFVNTEPEIEIPKTVQTQPVTEKNIAENYNMQSNTVKIKNESDYEITEEMLNIETNINNKNDILIYHTHTCESYTPSEKFNYAMTGNYRTTDNNYNVVKVGEELSTLLNKKGFNVVHDTTYYDYPSYSGSYARSLQAVENLLYEKTTQIVFDIHRDAVGDGASYGPTIKVGENSVAQLMFVIGTSGGGSEHANWIQNLKFAMEVQKKANEMYPGLFRPIIVRNSRYNQHVTTGASIIEVGATGNTLEECLLSMQCLSNVLEEYLK